MTFPSAHSGTCDDEHHLEPRHFVQRVLQHGLEHHHVEDGAKLGHGACSEEQKLENATFKNCGQFLCRHFAYCEVEAEAVDGSSGRQKQNLSRDLFSWR